MRTAKHPRNTLRVITRQVSDDGRSIKFRWQSDSHDDGECVALMPRPARATACLSTQLGCAVGCIFCATGQMGLQRNLSTDEILAQLDLVQSEVESHAVPLRNVVFMGMGEPFHNYDAVVDAVAEMLEPKAYGLGPRHITVSTAGVPSRMLDFARIYPRVRQALSLHSAIPEKRRRLVPRATADLNVLRKTLRSLMQLVDKSPIWLEYVLIAGYNDQQEDLEALIEFCRELDVEINIIPYNPMPELRSPSVPVESKGVRIQGQAESSTVRDPNDFGHATCTPMPPPTGQAIKDTCQASNSGSEDHQVTLARPSEIHQDWFIRNLRKAGIFTTLRKSLGQSIAAACGQLVATKKDA